MKSLESNCLSNSLMNENSHLLIIHFKVTKLRTRFQPNMLTFCSFLALSASPLRKYSICKSKKASVTTRGFTAKPIPYQTPNEP